MRHLFAGHLRILQYLIDGFNRRFELCCVDFFKARTANIRREVLTLEQRIYLNGGLRDARERSLGALAGTPQPTQSTRIIGDVELRLPLELVLEMPE